MRLESLVLLEDSEVRRLVAAWPAVFPLDEEMSDNMVRWGRISGVDPRKAARSYHMLMENEIIKKDGSIDQVAKEYITGLAMNHVRRK